jgi:hypothetical protein
LMERRMPRAYCFSHAIRLTACCCVIYSSDPADSWRDKVR